MAKRAQTKPRIQTLAISAIRVDEKIQPRANGLSDETVDEYTDAMRSGAKFPPLVVYHDPGENTYWLSEGFHRHAAARKAKRQTFRCEVHGGGRLAALVHACGSNSTHGLRRTNDDKRRAVELLTEQFGNDPKWTNRSIAKAAGVSHTFVNKLRDKSPQVETVSTPRAPGPSNTEAVTEEQDANESGANDDDNPWTADEPSTAPPELDIPDPPPPSGASLGNRPMGPDEFEVLRQGSREYLALLNLPYANMLFAIAAGEGSKTSVCKTIEAVIQHINKKRPEKK